MAMTFLQLVNRLRGECGVGNSDLAALTGLSGQNLKCKDWIADAYVELQNKRPDWEWMRTAFSFTTTEDQQLYTLANVGISATFASYKPDSFRIYRTADGYSTEQYLQHNQNYDEWRDVWQFGANRTNTGQPTEFVITPNKSIGLSPIPDDTGYTVLGEYYTTAVELSVAADEPAFPDRFHMILVYDAMMRYGVYEAAAEVYQRGEAKYRELMNQLELDQLPAIEFPEPLL